jgi:hypothetical protein
MEKIKTNNGNYYFTSQALYIGRKKINREVAKQNLLDFKRFSDKYQFSFGLIYGTLLGVIRENNFIEHDEDTDIFILEEQRNELLDLLFELRKIGFEVIRYDRRGLFSIMRNNEYIDIYIFRKFKKGIRICGGECIIERFLLETTSVEFLSETFNIPKDYLDFLFFQYGPDWRIPVVYSDFNIKSVKRLFIVIKEQIKNWLPDFLYFKLAEKNERKNINMFYQKLEQRSINL